jgi:serine/threonine protein kinase
MPLNDVHSCIVRCSNRVDILFDLQSSQGQESLRFYANLFADFGLAVNANEERPVTRLGTLDYMAPEVSWVQLGD